VCRGEAGDRSSQVEHSSARTKDDKRKKGGERESKKAQEKTPSVVVFDPLRLTQSRRSVHRFGQLGTAGFFLG
jgi:hypothetical protein